MIRKIITKQLLLIASLVTVNCAYSMDTNSPVSKSIIPFVKQPTVKEMLRLWKRERIFTVEFPYLERLYRVQFQSNCNDIEMPACIETAIREAKKQILESLLSSVIFPGGSTVEAFLELDEIMNGNR